MGDPDHVARAIRAHMQELGAGTFMGLFQFGSLPHDLACRNIELFAERVLPAAASRLTRRRHLAAPGPAGGAAAKAPLWRDASRVGRGERDLAGRQPTRSPLGVRRGRARPARSCRPQRRHGPAAAAPPAGPGGPGVTFGGRRGSPRQRESQVFQK